MSLLTLSFPGPMAVIGDVHGRSALLKQLLRELAGLPWVVVGDVCDRGPDTRGVLELLVAHQVPGVRGNHEEWLLRWARRQGFDSTALSGLVGGASTLDSYGVSGRTAREIEAEAWRFPHEQLAYLEGLADAISLELHGARYWVTHSGVPRLPPQAELLPPAEVIPWLAEHQPRLLHHAGRPPKKAPVLDRPVVMGHFGLQAPVDLGHVLAIDSSAAGTLSAVVLPERRFVTVGP